MRHERRNIHFSGAVQGVGFRYRTLTALSGLPVTGFVRNLPDGRVQMVLEGDPADVSEAHERVLHALRRYIRAEEAATERPTGEFTGFSIRR